MKIAVRPAVLERVRSSFAGKSVLVTGGASFIGSHLSEALLEIDANVQVVDDLSSGRLENLAGTEGRIKFEQADLRDADAARKACAGAEFVFHLAAVHGGRGYIDSHPVECLGNVILDRQIFDAAAASGSRKVIVTSSACVYPISLQGDPGGRNLLREPDAGIEGLGGASPDGAYGWAKLTAEVQLRAYAEQRGISGVACRLFTAFGERENESHAAIALIAKALARLDPFPIWGTGEQTRNFTYVGDTVAGLLLSAAFTSGFESVNVGTSKHTRVIELADMIFQLVGWRPHEIDRQLDRPTGVASRAADNSKCRSMLGWEPDWQLDEALARTVDWYRKSTSDEELATLNTRLMSRG